MFQPLIRFRFFDPNNLLNINFWYSGSSTDRMKRLVTHLFEQKIFYPLIPPAEEMTIDMTILTDYAQIPYIPHLMILPSEMRHFIKVIHEIFVHK